MPPIYKNYDLNKNEVGKKGYSDFCLISII